MCLFVCLFLFINDVGGLFLFLANHNLLFFKYLEMIMSPDLSG